MLALPFTPSSFFLFLISLLWFCLLHPVSSVSIRGVHSMGAGHPSSSLLTASIWAASGTLYTWGSASLQWPHPAGSLAISTHILIREGIIGWGWTWGGSVSIQGQVQGLLSRESSPECQGQESSSDGPLFPGGMTDDLGLPSGENPLNSASWSS